MCLIMQGGTFTISNLGMFGVKNFSAIINPPQVGGTTVRKKRFILVLYFQVGCIDTNYNVIEAVGKICLLRLVTIRGHYLLKFLAIFVHKFDLFFIHFFQEKENFRFDFILRIN